MDRPYRTLLPFLVAALGVAGAPATAQEPASVSVSVAMDRMVFPDGLYRAAFRADGACISANDDVEVTVAACGTGGADVTEGTLRRAVLGFDAIRKVEALPADAPLAETAQAAAPEQLDAVSVRLREAGDLTVQIAGTPAEGVDPRPVPGSASPSSGEIADRAVTWRLPGQGPGTYLFSVRFRPGAPAGSAGTFVPEVRVELRTSSGVLLRHAGGEVSGQASRVSALTMRQRVAPASGPPALSTDRFHAAPGAGPLPVTWETQVALDARGQYQSLASGDVSASTRGPFEELTPGGLGVLDTAFMTTAWYDVRGQGKAQVWMGFERLDDGTLSGFRATVRTPPPADPFGLQAGGATLWDGDTMSFGVSAGAHTLDAGRKGPPVGPEGVVAPDWNGGTVHRWSGTWANVVPAAEPNAVNPQNYLAPIYGYGVLDGIAATIPMVATGGDVDNRSGGSPESGEPAVIDLFPAECASSAIWINVFLAQTKYSAGLSSLLNCPSAATLTPNVGAGGYWLRSTRDGYYRDWSNVTFLSIAATDRGQPGRDVVPVHRVVALVPAGAAAEALAVDVATGREYRAALTPGTWVVTLTSDGLAVDTLH